MIGACLASAPFAAAAGSDLDVVIRDNARGRVIETVSRSSEVVVGHNADLSVVVTPRIGEHLGRVSLGPAPGADPACTAGAGRAVSVRWQAPYRFDLEQGPDCRWLIEVGAETKLNIRIRRTLPDAATLAPFRREDVVRGTTDASSLNLGPVGTRAEHGVRVHCTVSHYAYDDPIVFPGEPDRAHLHMFFGNTETNAHSDLASLHAANRTTCDGGANLKSGYWMPALLNGRGEVVLPEHLLVYYKSFVLSPVSDEGRLESGLIRPIPDGLEMLSGPTAAHASGDPAQHSLVRRENGKLKLTTIFPQCVAIHPDGRPVLSHRDMPGAEAGEVNSHLAYQVWKKDSRDGCPASHPYRIPGLFINAWYDVAPNDRWFLSSDTDRSRPGHSLHADYVAAWNPADMARVVRCNEERRSCGFDQDAQWGPDRFHDWSGARRYLNVWVLENGQSRTPWGSSLPPTRNDGGQHGGHGGGHQETWTKCADEAGRCAAGSGATVRYGANGHWRTRTLSGTISCSNATFGGDPVPGVRKACYVGDASEPPAEPTTQGPSEPWTKCADEAGRCAAGTGATVRYGANGRWRVRTLSGTVACTNATFGGDPIVGVRKACYVGGADAPPTPTTAWTKCAEEQGRCALTTAATVRYGANGRWVTKTLGGPFACTNAAFGRDPAPGVRKACYVQGSSA